jgi:hypothetical protein
MKEKLNCLSNVAVPCHLTVAVMIDAQQPRDVRWVHVNGYKQRHVIYDLIKIGHGQWCGRFQRPIRQVKYNIWFSFKHYKKKKKKIKIHLICTKKTPTLLGERLELPPLSLARAAKRTPPLGQSPFKGHRIITFE